MKAAGFTVAWRSGRRHRTPAARRSCLGYAGLAQPGEKRGLGQGVGLRRAKQSQAFEAGYAGIALVAAQPTRLREFGIGMFGLAFERITGSQPRVRSREPGISAPRFF